MGEVLPPICGDYFFTMKKIKVDDYLEMLISMMPENLEFVNNTEKCVCAVMHYIADDDSNPDGVFQMPMTTLENQLKIHRNTAGAAVKSLLKKGYFEIVKQSSSVEKSARVYKSNINEKSICASVEESICASGLKSICAYNNNNNRNNNNNCNRNGNDNCKRNKKNKDNNKNNVSHKSYAVNATQHPTLNNYMKVEVKGNILEVAKSASVESNCMNSSIISNVEDIAKVKDNTLNATAYTYEDNNCINNSIIDDIASAYDNELNGTKNTTDWSTYNSILEDITNAVQERYTASDALNYGNTTNHSTAEETTPYSEDNNGIALIDNSTLEETESANERGNCINNSIIEDNAKVKDNTLNATDNNNALDTSIVNYFNDIENKGLKSVFESINPQKVYSNSTDAEITAQNRSIETVGNNAIDKDKNTTAMEIQDYQLEAIEDYINSKKGITYAKFYAWLGERFGKLQSKKKEWQFNSYASTITAFVDKYYPKVKDKKQEIDYFHELVNATVNYLRNEMFTKAKETPDAFIAKLREVKQAFNTASGAFLALKENGNDVAEVFCNAFDILVKVFTELEEANKDYEEFKQVAPYNPVNSSDFRINEMRAKFTELKHNKVA